MVDPTVYPELNALLDEFVAGVRAILAENFCGAYLQGSFAVGDADEHSDVDFLIVTVDEVTDEQLAALQTLHERIYALDVPWAQHLEGSYVPRDRLHELDPARSPFLYLDNGASELEWDNHCNTAVVRWSLRERGVTLAGPDPKSLVAPVSTADLRSDVLAALHDYAEWAPAPTKADGMSQWKQVFLVLTCCRSLCTLERGEVSSKREGGEWALGALDAEWAGLVRRALDDRPDPWGRVHRPADPERAARTLAFIAYALDEAARSFRRAGGLNRS